MRTLAQFKIHAFSHYVTKKVDARGVMWLYETGRMPLGLENEIDGVLGSGWYKELAYILAGHQYESTINPKTTNLKRIEAAANKLAAYILEKHPLYKRLDS